jgi:VAD1 Analog of StAR-related lipid transfer domain
MDTFYILFLQDEASSSLDHYQRDFIRDRDVRISPWMNDSPTEVPRDEITVNSRVLTFIHPIKSTMGMGPSEAKTTRKQILRSYQQYGMTLENITTVEGIPAADTFSVHDFWRIEADGSDAITISANFAPRFTKRTIFKNLIEKSVLKETKAWFLGYAEMILQTLEKSKCPVPNASTNTSIGRTSENQSFEIDYRRMYQFLVWSAVCVLLLTIVLLLIGFKILGVLTNMQDELVAFRISISQTSFDSLERGYQCNG